jgi:hypothetical protein
VAQGVGLQFSSNPSPQNKTKKRVDVIYFVHDESISGMMRAFREG